MINVLAALRAIGTIMLTAIPVLFLWNGTLAEAVSAVRPINYIQAVGMQILAMLMQQSLSFYYIRGAVPSSPQGEIKP